MSGNPEIGISGSRQDIIGGSLLDPGGAFSDVSVACFRGGFRRKRGPLPGGAVGQISDPVFAGGTGFRALTARVARTSGAGLTAPNFGARTSGASRFWRKFPPPPSATPRSYPPAAPLPPSVSRTRNFGQFFAPKFFLPEFQRTWVGWWGVGPTLFLEFFEIKELF